MNSHSVTQRLESISHEIGEYKIQITPWPYQITVRAEDEIIAQSKRALVLHETRLEPVFYFPKEDVRMDYMHSSTHSTYCPFKGNASYWTLVIDENHHERKFDNVMWGYETPMEESKAISGYVAFFRNLVEIDDGSPRLKDSGKDSGKNLGKDVAVDNDDVQGNHSTFSNPLLSWLLHEAPNARDAYDLTDQLIEQLLRANVSLWRFALIIPTLHPQVMALSYRWWAKRVELREDFISYEMLQEPEYLNSPLVPIFEGAGGIRRRLDIDNPNLDYGILKELRDEGASDYVAMPLTFSDGQINVLTIASQQPGGFSTRELGHVYEVLSVLGRLYEVHVTRRIAATLLDTYLGEHAGHRVLQGQIQRGDGEVINAVIWFCDLRESTELAQSMSQTEFLSLLNDYYDCMAGAVLNNGGQVLRFIGDAALAIFPVDDDTALASAKANALAAASDAIQRFDALNAQRQTDGLRQLGFGLALHVGEVTYGNIGTENRLEFTVIGDAANRAARIESLCKPLSKRVLVSKDFAQNDDQFVSVGRHELRGVDTPQEIFTFAHR